MNVGRDNRSVVPILARDFFDEVTHQAHTMIRIARCCPHIKEQGACTQNIAVGVFIWNRICVGIELKLGSS